MSIPERLVGRNLHGQWGSSNLGLRDKRLGLEWVRDNIASFGGNPSQVTVFSESARAISIAIHMLNETQDLFRGAIMESGAQSTLPCGKSADPAAKEKKLRRPSGIRRVQ